MAMERKTLYKIGGGTVLVGVLGFLVLTSPLTWSVTHPGRTLPELAGANLSNGRNVFLASDCATCHETQGQEDDTVLGGGRALDTEFGVFHMPNISPDKATGIGNWTLDQFDRALREGSAPAVCWAMDATSIRPSPTRRTSACRARMCAISTRTS